MQNSRKIAAEIIVIIAFILLAAYIADAGIARANNGHGFLPLSAKDRGMIFGGGSIILFFISFAIGFNIRSKILTTLLIIGGALMGTSVLISTLIPDNTNIQANPASQQMASPQFLGIIIVGYVIMGLGIWRGIRKK
jgi:predicted membrane-bound spermidine synthase